MSSPENLPTLRFAYMVIAARDLEVLCEWYGRMLGFRRIHGGYLEELDTDFAVLEGQGIRMEITAPRSGEKHGPG